MTNTKIKILEAAEELIAENGIADTTIANVAQKAEVVDSLIYKYFRNKEDLLFSIADLIGCLRCGQIGAEVVHVLPQHLETSLCQGRDSLLAMDSCHPHDQVIDPRVVFFRPRHQATDVDFLVF